MLDKKILLLTYHFPPSAASGTFRLLGFTRHLPAFGWQPLVVAPPSLPWEPLDPQLVSAIPAEAVVRQAPYPASAPSLLRMPAQNAVWLPRAWFACKRLSAEHRPDAILTSGPPHCVHVLGHYLKRSLGVPWVADFRDPWISDGTSKKLGWVQRWALRWEHAVFANADLILANAPNATRMFQETYPGSRDKIVTLTNGFDPPVGQALLPAATDTNVCPAHLCLVHAGEIYAGRDPRPLLEALTRLNAEAVVPTYRLQVLGRNEINLETLLQERGWTELVEVIGQLAYQESLAAMRRADILVLFDSPGRTIGVPAKLYEYLGAGRPILALAEPNGDVAAVLRASGVLHRIVSPQNAGQIHQALGELTQAMRATDAVADGSLLERFTRRHIAQTLARRLAALVGAPTVTSLRVDCAAAAAETRVSAMQETA